MTDGLSTEQLKLLQLLASGTSMKAASRTLHVSPRTCRRWMTRLQEQLDYDTDVQVIVWAVKSKLI